MSAQAKLYAVVLLVGAAALVCALAAYLAGRPACIERSAGRAAHAVRRSRASGEIVRWVAGHADALRITIVAGTVVLVVSGHELAPVLIVAAAVGACLWAVSELTQRFMRQRPATRIPDVEAPEREAGGIGTRGEGTGVTPNG